MAILKIARMGHPVLAGIAQRVEAPMAPEVHGLIADMVETMHAEQGVGLAANQIGSLQKVAVIQLPDWEEAIVLINPEIVSREGEREVVEGCLSIPGYRGLVKRSVSVRARAIGLDGKVIRIKADGLLAQALEHETGHLQCSLYIDHLVTPDDLWKIPQGGEEEEVEEPGEDNGPGTESAEHSHEPGE